MKSPIRIGIVAEARYLSQNQPMGLCNELEKRGHMLTMVDPQKAFYTMGDSSWFQDMDIIVGRGRSWGLLALLKWAESEGKVTLNRQEAISAVHNKAHMSLSFAGSDVPIPETYLGNVEYLANEIPGDSYPIILKPIFGDNSRGLLVVETPEKLSRTDWPEPVALAQRYFRTNGYDLKLYGIADRIWAIRKKSPFNEPTEEISEGEVSLTPELEELGIKCGKLFGLELFGVDCIITNEGPLVIEINDYPNYTKATNANSELADYVVKRAGEGR